MVFHFDPHPVHHFLTKLAIKFVTHTWRTWQVLQKLAADLQLLVESVHPAGGRNEAHEKLGLKHEKWGFNQPKWGFCVCVCGFIYDVCIKNWNFSSKKMQMSEAKWGIASMDVCFERDYNDKSRDFTVFVGRMWTRSQKDFIRDRAGRSWKIYRCSQEFPLNWEDRHAQKLPISDVFDSRIGFTQAASNLTTIFCY